MKINWMPNCQTQWLLCALFLCGGSAIAQTPTVQPEAKQATTLTHGFFSPQSYRVKSDLDESLSLTPEQKQQMKAVQDEVFALALQESQRRREERRSGVKPTVEERKFAMIRLGIQLTAAIREVHKHNIALLNAEQKALVEKVDATVKAVADEVGAPSM